MIRLRRYMLIAVMFLLLIVLLMLAASYALFGTERGFALTTAQLSERVEGLEIAPVSGDLVNGISTNSLAFSNDAIALDATGIESQWRSGCLLDREVCIDQVTIDELNIETFASTEPPSQDPQTDIALPRIDLPISFDVKEVLVKKLKLKLPGDGPVQELSNVFLSAHSEGKRLHIDELSTRYQSFAVKAQGNITPEGDYPLDLNIQLDAVDVVEEHDFFAKVNLSNSLNDLKINASVDGAAKLNVTGSARPLEKELPLSLVLDAPLLGWPIETKEIVTASNTRVRVEGDMEKSYQVDAQTRVKGEQIPASEARIRGRVNAEQGIFNELTVATLGGFATGNAAVSWRNDITWVSEIIAKDIQPEKHFAEINGKLNGLFKAQGTAADGKWSVFVDRANVDGTLKNIPFKVDAKLQKDLDNNWRIDQFALDNGNNSVQAAGSIGNTWDLQADVKLPELQNFWTGLAGGFNAKVDLGGDIKNPDANINASASVIKVNDIVVQGLSLKADVKRAAYKDSNVQLALGKIKAGEQEAANTRLQLTGKRNDHQLSFFTDGPQKTSIDLIASGALSEQFDWDGVLSKVVLEVPAHKINLKDDTALVWDNGEKKFSVDAHCWAVQDSNVCLKNRVLAEPTGTAQVTLDAYKLEQLNPFLPANSLLQGKLAADLVVDWGAEQEGGYKITLGAGIEGGGIEVKDNNGSPIRFDYNSLTLNTTADTKAVDSTLTVNSTTMGKAKLALKLDPASEEKNITGDIDLTGFKLDFLKAFLPEFEEIGGSVSAKGTLGGELLDPQYDGNVTLSQLVVKSDTLPLGIDSGNVQATVKGKRANISGKLQSGEGNIDVNGSANWQSTTWRADVNLNANDLQIIQDPLTDSSVNTNINISAKPGSVSVSGDVDVPMASINIRELPKGATALSQDVIIIEDQEAQEEEEKAKAASDLALNIRVNVNLGDQVSLTGYGLEADLTGDISVSQRTPNPVQLGGEVTIVSGIFKQYGQDLTITDGQILFVGPIDQTTLNIDAIRLVESGEREAGLHIDGRIEDPQLTLFTEPADKTQESILSYIVLGRDIGNNTDQESNLLASALIALTLKQGRGYTDDLADSLGIQEISLDARGNGDDTEVVVSGRVNDRLLLRYGRSVFDDDFTLYLRYDLTKQLYLEAARGAARAVDIFYTFSF